MLFLETWWRSGKLFPIRVQRVGYKSDQFLFTVQGKNAPTYIYGPFNRARTIQDLHKLDARFRNLAYVPGILDATKEHRVAWIKVDPSVLSSIWRGLAPIKKYGPFSMDEIERELAVQEDWTDDLFRGADDPDPDPEKPMPKKGTEVTPAIYQTFQLVKDILRGVIGPDQWKVHTVNSTGNPPDLWISVDPTVHIIAYSALKNQMEKDRVFSAGPGKGFGLIAIKAYEADSLESDDYSPSPTPQAEWVQAGDRCIQPISGWLGT